jgi:hypothetical protein
MIDDLDKSKEQATSTQLLRQDSLKQHQKNEVGLEITEKKVKEEKIVTFKKEL